MLRTKKGFKTNVTYNKCGIWLGDNQIWRQFCFYELCPHKLRFWFCKHWYCFVYNVNVKILKSKIRTEVSSNLFYLLRNKTVSIFNQCLVMGSSIGVYYFPKLKNPTTLCEWFKSVAVFFILCFWALWGDILIWPFKKPLRETYECWIQQIPFLSSVLMAYSWEISLFFEMGDLILHFFNSY